MEPAADINKVPLPPDGRNLEPRPETPPKTRPPRLSRWYLRLLVLGIATCVALLLLSSFKSITLAMTRSPLMYFPNDRRLSITAEARSIRLFIAREAPPPIQPFELVPVFFIASPHPDSLPGQIAPVSPPQSLPESIGIAIESLEAGKAIRLSLIWPLALFATLLVARCRTKPRDLRALLISKKTLARLTRWGLAALSLFFIALVLGSRSLSVSLLCIDISNFNRNNPRNSPIVIFSFAHGHFIHLKSRTDPSSNTVWCCRLGFGEDLFPGPVWTKFLAAAPIRYGIADYPQFTLVSLLYPAAAFTLPALLTVLPLLRRRPKPGHCPHCHYNLQATPTQCSECGHIPTTTTST